MVYQNEPLSDENRKFRIEKFRYYTEEEISKMTNGTDRPVMEFCGGYNCRHKVRPVILSPKEEEALTV